MRGVLVHGHDVWLRHRQSVLRGQAAAIAVEGHPGIEGQGPALHGAAGVQRDGLVRQDRALEDRVRAEHRRGAHLPEDVPGLGAAGQDDMDTAAELQIGGNLEDPDIARATGKGKVRAGDQRRARELVEAGDKVQSTDIAAAGIQKGARGYRGASGGIVVGDGQIPFGRGQHGGGNHGAGRPAGVDRVDDPVHLGLGHADGRPGDRTGTDVASDDTAARRGHRGPGQNREVCRRSQVEHGGTRRAQPRLLSDHGRGHGQA